MYGTYTLCTYLLYPSIPWRLPVLAETTFPAWIWPSVVARTAHHPRSCRRRSRASICSLSGEEAPRRRFGVRARLSCESCIHTLCLGMRVCVGTCIYAFVYMCVCVCARACVCVCVCVSCVLEKAVVELRMMMRESCLWRTCMCQLHPGTRCFELRRMHMSCLRTSACTYFASLWSWVVHTSWYMYSCMHECLQSHLSWSAMSCLIDLFHSSRAFNAAGAKEPCKASSSACNNMVGECTPYDIISVFCLSVSAHAMPTCSFASFLFVCGFSTFLLCESACAHASLSVFVLVNCVCMCVFVRMCVCVHVLHVCMCVYVCVHV